MNIGAVRRALGLAGLLLVAATGDAWAVGRLEVQLRHGGGAGHARIDDPGGVIEVVLGNIGDEPIQVASTTEPRVNSAGVLVNNVFDLVTDAGKPAQYLGIYYSLGDVEEPYVHIEPGRFHVLRVDLTQSYRLQPDTTYFVSMRPVRYLSRPRASYRGVDRTSIGRFMLESEPVGRLVWSTSGVVKPSTAD